MNKIYVDELPKSCLNCPCYDGEFMRCNLIQCEHSVGYFNEDEMDYKYIPINQYSEELTCPLKPLSEERKGVEAKFAKYNRIYRFHKETIDNLEKQVQEQFNLIDQLTQNADNQIAIQELNSLKIIIKRKNNAIRKGHYSENYKDGYSACCCDIQDIIDFTIKELKGEKNGN